VNEIRIDFGRLDPHPDPLCQVAGGQKDTLKKENIKESSQRSGSGSGSGSFYRQARIGTKTLISTIL
jgi:hypothetical protein